MLFSSNEIISKKNTEVKADPVMSVALDNNESAFIGRGHEAVKYVLKELKPGKTIHYCTEGHFHLHELVDGLIRNVTGPVNYYMTTWAISEDPIRCILKLIEDGYITELNCVFDYKTKTNAPKAFQLANSIVTRTKLTHVHAKMKVLQNDKWTITINGSANDTNNSRLEAGVITTDIRIGNIFKEKIMQILTTDEVK